MQRLLRLARCFQAVAPNQVWLADLIYIPTAERWLYLAAIPDIHARKIVGWSMRQTLHFEIALKALNMAIERQRPAHGLVHHSDRGIQHAAEARRSGLDLVMSCEQGEVAMASDGRGILIAEQRYDDPHPGREVLEGPPSPMGPQGCMAPISQLADFLGDDVAVGAANAITRTDILSGQRLAFAMVQSRFEASRMTTPADITPGPPDPGQDRFELRARQQL